MSKILMSDDFSVRVTQRPGCCIPSDCTTLGSRLTISVCFGAASGGSVGENALID